MTDPNIVYYSEVRTVVLLQHWAEIGNQIAESGGLSVIRRLASVQG